MIIKSTNNSSKINNLSSYRANKLFSLSAFSLIEILLVIAFLSVVAATGMSLYRNYLKSVEADTAADIIISDLKNIQTKAISGEDNLKWGIHFINGESDYYETFSTATDYAAGTVKDTFYLPGTIVFSDPSEGNIKDIIFNKISGTISSETTLTIGSDIKSRTITVTAIGNIY